MIEIVLDKKADMPLYAQIRNAVQNAIEHGILKPGDRLPTVTAFAKDVGVTQATIRRALEDLSKDGYITSHVGRGTFVCSQEELTTHKMHRQSHSDLSSLSTAGDPELASVTKRFRMGIRKGLNDLMMLTRRPGLIHFTRGLPDPDLMREGCLKDLINDALTSGQRRYQVCGDPMGIPELREEIAKRFSNDNSRISPDQVLITNGSQQAVALLAQSALENSQRVICETPCFMGITNAFGALGHWVESVPRDAEGPIPERLNRFRDGKPSLLYLCPELHNPMGTDLSPERRTVISEWAREQQAVLLADEIFHDFRFEGNPPKSLLTETGAQHTVVISSFSKTFMDGLRVGWLITSAERIRSIVPLKRAMDIVCPPLMQGIALSLLRTGEYKNHVQKIREYYRPCRDMILDALTRFMPEGVSWTVPKGGFHMWVELPSGYSSIALFLLAIERGIAIIPGPLLDLEHRFVHAFRLSYGSVKPEHITEGIELLAEAVKELLNEPPKDSGLSGLGDFR